MLKIKSNRHLIITIIIAAALLIYLVASKSGVQIKNILFEKPFQIIVLIYQDDNNSADKLDAFVVCIDGKSKLIKVLSIDTNMKAGKNISLKKSFYNTSKKDLKLAKENFYSSLENLFGDKLKSAYYINIDYKTLSKMIFVRGKLLELILKNDFKNIDDREIAQLEISELLLNRFERLPFLMLFSIEKNYKKTETNLSRLFFWTLTAYIQISKNSILFYDLPANQVSLATESLKLEMREFLDNTFFASPIKNNGRLDGFIEIRNASDIQGAAQSLAWFLRENGLDVLDYLNSSFILDETIIKDYRGNIFQAKKIADIIKCGKIIVSYDGAHYYDTTVIIGADYKLKGVKTRNE
ncbi:MAG: LytR C-terminal domain-containing protein [Elusimicrobiota bacterium]|jgi:hypothetical protein|nr:LytR C-terminal domain-containing protein [Elusimicrobiota bacterium]